MSKVIIDATYVIKPPTNNNPFSKPPVKVKVLDAKQGWVKYGILRDDGTIGIFNNESIEEESFLKMYDAEDVFLKCIKENQ